MIWLMVATGEADVLDELETYESRLPVENMELVEEATEVRRKDEKREEMEVKRELGMMALAWEKEVVKQKKRLVVVEAERSRSRREVKQ